MVDSTRRKTLIAGGELLAGAGLLSASGSSLAQSGDKYGIRGQIAPEIEIDYWIDLNGKPTSFSVEAEKGKWVFLKYFQNWCPGCHSSGFPTLKAFSDEFHDHPDVAIAGVQTVFEGFKSNSREAVRELQLKYELPITMGHDPGNPETHKSGKTMANYRTGGTPWLVLINPEGRVVFNDYHVNSTALIMYVNEQLA